MQSQLLNQNMSNAKSSEKTNSNYNNIKTKYNKLKSKVDAMQKRSSASKCV